METALTPIKLSNFIRVDRNLSENSLDWLGIFGKDAMLCFDIILYISNNAQRDIFNYGKIDLNHFCKTMGYTKQNLHRVAEEPAQMELKVKSALVNLDRDKKFMTVFENALYKLGLYNIPVTSSTFDQDKKEYILSTNFIQIIKEIKIHITPGKAFSKMFYSYCTSEEFDYNLCRYFFFTDMNIVKELREKNLLLLYFYLKNIENGHHHQFVERDFLKLCLFAGLKPNEDNIRYTKKNLQTRKLAKIKEYIDFDYSPVCVSGHWKYGYAFTFNANKQYEKENDRHVIMAANTDHVDLKLMKFYKRKYKVLGEVDKKAYKDWFFNKDQDYDKKIDIYLSSIAELYKISKSVAASKHSGRAAEYFIREKKASL